MRQLEADIRKHIRIEHQLKLHIESVEDRVEELERAEDDYENKIKELVPYKQEVTGLRKELKSKEEVLEVKQILLEKQKAEIEDL
jgi:predicted  nucleic acid-binding Zn-ribbon protein